MGLPSVPGIATSYRVPIVGLALNLGQGVRSAATSGQPIFLVGSRAYDTAGTVAQGSATDAEIYQIYSAADAATYWGDHSELARMAKYVFAEFPGAIVYGSSAAKNAGAPVRGTADIVLGAGTPTVAGTATMRIADIEFDVAITASEAVDDVGTAIAAAVNGNLGSSDCPVFATYTGGTNTLTLTSYCFGPSGNSIKFKLENLPTGMSATGSSGNLATGALEPTWATPYTNMMALDTTMYFIVPATCTYAVLNGTGDCIDTIQAGLAADVGKIMDAVVGDAGDAPSTTATTLADSLDTGTSSYDEPAMHFQVVWSANSYHEPWCLAAAVCGARAKAETEFANANWCGFSGYRLKSLVCPPLASEAPTQAELNTALCAGVTPIKYLRDSDVCVVVRSITAKWEKPEGSQFYLASDTNIPAVGRAVTYGLKASLMDEYDGMNITDDDANGDPPDDLPANTTTPSLIACTIQRLLVLNYEKEGYITNCNQHWDDGKLTVERNATNTQRIDAEIPIEVTRWLCQIAGNVREIGE